MYSSIFPEENFKDEDIDENIVPDYLSKLLSHSIIC